MANYFLNSAILHIFDFMSDKTVLSQQSLNLEDTLIESYVNKQITKIMSDTRSKEGYFQEGSQFLSLLKTYQNKDMNFVDLSLNISNRLEGYLKNAEIKTYDVLFMDYSYDEVPYIAFVLLENQSAYTHFTKQENGIVSNTITQQHSLLPSATKKASTFAFVNLINMHVSFVDKTDWGTKDIEVIQEMILDCTCEKSKEEVFKEVNEVVKEVAVKTDTNPTLLLSKYKNYVKESIEEETPITTEDLATHVFNETNEMQDAFISTTLEHEIPKKVEVPKQYVTTKLKNQKIKTDTGIELSFPTEYSENSHFIEFRKKDDGTISIEIKNVAKITNKQ